MIFLFFYTDPGSGMMLLQLLLATLAGGFFYFRSFFFKLFGRRQDTSALNKSLHDSASDQSK